MKKIIPQSIKNIYHLAQAILANLFLGFPGKKMRVIGVTGTNGKTTTVQLIAKVLESSGAKVAMASTINFKVGEKEWVNDTKFTTLSAWKTLSFTKKALKEKCQYLILEVGSHALDQFRTFGMKFDVAVVTNVTREHLDYHKTMEKYRRTKMRLFQKARVAVVNLDMEHPEDFLGLYNEKKYGFSTEISNESLMAGEKNYRVEVLFASKLELEPDSSSYFLDDVKFELNLPGKFNVENSLAAICVGKEYGVPEEKMKEALAQVKGVPGRLEKIPNDLGLRIMIDYAVTPDSLEKLYEYVSKTKKEGKIISVFGSCGERDRGKRPIMGNIVDEVADYIILTNEDPYGEDPWQIINEVAKGVKNKKEGENFWQIMDRRVAIAKALKLARPGDTVLVTGKGAEEIMAVGEKRIPWNDKKVIEEELKKIK